MSAEKEGSISAALLEEHLNAVWIVDYERYLELASIADLAGDAARDEMQGEIDRIDGHDDEWEEGYKQGRMEGMKGRASDPQAARARQSGTNTVNKYLKELANYLVHLRGYVEHATNKQKRCALMEEIWNKSVQVRGRADSVEEWVK